ncbi:Ger(x)C family spore germination protein [Paenibacillus sp. CF384]|uniref:Ger(x)C family spore germination protein n=1 Tax=Paenibacillus sp. CF384 TaxID=1884382 RepID=UPI000896F27F|nr:Ger(x)C family spore germination protein [Paenibacillus sp. CF384]SDX11784.1 germination protein, Ger(x)C family [Paenibacillus sp. CF384]
MNVKLGAKIGACLLTVTLLLTGCWDYKNIEEVLYATAIGYDYNKGKTIVYVQIVSLSSATNAEQGSSGGGQPQIWVGRGVGRTPSEAAGDLYSTAQRKIEWSHIRSVLISDRMLRHMGPNGLDSYQRYREFRYSSWVYATKEPVDKVLKAQSFFTLSPLTTSMQSPRDSHSQRSIYPMLTFQELMLGMLDPGYTTTIPALALDTEKWSNDQNKRDPHLKIEGVFVMDETKAQGYIPEKKMMGLRWFQPDMIRTPVLVANGVVSMEKAKSKIKFTKRGDEVLFTIDVSTHGNIVEWLSEEGDESAVVGEVSANIAREIRETYETNINKGIDLYNFRHHLFQGRVKNWKTIKIDESSLKAVNVKVYIDHAGKSTI